MGVAVLPHLGPMLRADDPLAKKRATPSAQLRGPARANQ